MIKRVIRNESDMNELGKQIAGLLRGGELIELIGDVGAGKTTLTRSMLRAAGVSEAIQSPTFTVCNRYSTPTLDFAHYDFYRLGEAGIMQDEFIETSHEPRTVSIVEWGDVVAGTMPADRLTLTITADSETSRQVSIAGHGKLQAFEGQLA